MTQDPLGVPYETPQETATRVQDVLMGDFQRFMTIVLFKDYCDRQGDPKAFGEHIIAEWRNRLITHTDTKLVDGRKAALQDHLNDVEQILRRVLNL